MSYSPSSAVQAVETNNKCCRKKKKKEKIVFARSPHAVQGSQRLDRFCHPHVDLSSYYGSVRWLSLRSETERNERSRYSHGHERYTIVKFVPLTPSIPRDSSLTIVSRTYATSFNRFDLLIFLLILSQLLENIDTESPEIMLIFARFYAISRRWSHAH